MSGNMTSHEEYKRAARHFHVFQIRHVQSVSEYGGLTVRKVPLDFGTFRDGHYRFVMPAYQQFLFLMISIDKIVTIFARVS